MKVSFTYHDLPQIACENELWIVHDEGENLRDLMYQHLPKLCRMCLYTLAPSYLQTTHLYSTRYTCVFSMGDPHELIGFASFNIEYFELPEEIDRWTGHEKLTTNSIGRPPAKRGHKLNIPVCHVSSIITDPKYSKSLHLGSRLLNFQKLLTMSYNFSHGLLALEAIKPLDLLFYPTHSFYTTTDTFFRKDHKSIRPMFFKLQTGTSAYTATLGALQHVPIWISLEQLHKRNPTFQYQERQAMHDTEHWNIVPSMIQNEIRRFLWDLKDHVLARTTILEIEAKYGFSKEEVNRLWRQRRYTLAYKEIGHSAEFDLQSMSTYPLFQHIK